MKYEAIVLAAGMGKRMNAGKNKVFLTLMNTPILIHTLRPFVEDERCTHIVLVARNEEIENLTNLTKGFDKPITVVSGGAERQNSVFEGLKAVKNTDLGVFIHDGARPFVTQEQLHQLSDALDHTRCALFGVPVKDTIKKVVEGFVEETVPRETLYQAQTPQAFHTKTILDAHLLAVENEFLGTDDVSLIENYFPDTKIQMVQGSYENIKITTPEDLIFGEAILKSRGVSE